MLQVLYILAFTVLAVLAISNLMRSLFTLGVESHRYQPQENRRNTANGLFLRPNGTISHPELLDDKGNLTNEPLLVMRSISMEDAREHLNALYESSPGYETDHSDD